MVRKRSRRRVITAARRATGPGRRLARCPVRVIAGQPVVLLASWPGTSRHLTLGDTDPVVRGGIRPNHDSRIAGWMVNHKKVQRLCL